MASVAPKSTAKKGRSTTNLKPLIFLLTTGGIGAAIVYSDVDFGNLDDHFEDFNEWSRDYFLSVADYLCPPDEKPWLLDFETLKYPEHLATLVLDLDKLICKLEYDRKTGWQVVKRPGADRLFHELQHYCEIVVYSDEMYPVAQDVLQRWGIPVYNVLHREFCRKKRTHFVKDIGRLGRKMERVIHVDHDPVSVQKYPENSIVLPEYNGDPEDTELLDLIDFLKAAVHQPDVRPFIQKYGGDGEVGKRYALEMQEREKVVKQRRSMSRMFGSNGGGGMLSRTQSKDFNDPMRGF